jgi:hypothetical protein
VRRAAVQAAPPTRPTKPQASAAGAPPDLGPPDEEGVFTYHGRGGAKLYFRVAPRPFKDAAPHAGPPLWQWSTSRRLWLPTSAVGGASAGAGREGCTGVAGRAGRRRPPMCAPGAGVHSSAVSGQPR